MNEVRSVIGESLTRFPGIGRTGVLILMDTALALMDAREPVYPLDIVQGMRDQRACMVQNVVRISIHSFHLCSITLVHVFRVNTALCANVYAQLMLK